MNSILKELQVWESCSKRVDKKREPELSEGQDYATGCWSGWIRYQSITTNSLRALGRTEEPRNKLCGIFLRKKFYLF